ncbi:MAG: hypothetical protein KF886_12220 [Candidatus Hydrogenedentes bacterium]|nr:hypothetical protein [Candidatus Hydrogenedentota bacterium]
MRVAPNISLYTWRLVAREENLLRFRPTLHTALRRSAFTLLCFLIAGFLEWNHLRRDHRLFEPVDFTRSSLSPEEREAAQRDAEAAFEGILDEAAMARVREEAAARQAAHQRNLAEETERYNTVRRGLFYAHYGAVGFLVLAGAVAPLSCLWNRVTIRRTREDELEIRSFVFRPRTARWPLHEFYGIRTFVKERYSFYRNGRIASHHWEWIVQIALRGQPQMPLGSGLSLGFGGAAPQFIVFREKHQPSLIGKAPGPVRDLVKGLRELTGLMAEPPQIVEGQVVGRRKVAYRASIAETEETPVATRRHTFRPGDPIPEDLRARIAAMTGDRTEELPDGGQRHFTQDIVVTDEQGRSVRYASIDDLPEEVRRRLGL